MPSQEGLGWTFDTVAPLYERMRPGYVPALYETLFQYIPIHEESMVVEVGAGGGQATGPILKTGCTLTAVECGAQFSALLQEKFRAYPKFSVCTAKFEEAAFPSDAFDLVFSASAFHWVPEQIGYGKVYAMLRSGGAFARFANHPYRDKGNPDLSRALDDLYARFYYPFYNRPPTTIAEYTEQEAADRANIAERYGFTDIRYALFHRQRVFTAEEYLQLLGTYSDHIAMEESVRTPFFAGIATAIRDHGGTITLYDTIDLQLARKP